LRIDRNRVTVGWCEFCNTNINLVASFEGLIRGYHPDIKISIFSPDMRLIRSLPAFDPSVNIDMNFFSKGIIGLE
jgi:hypothetical protein